MEPGSVYSKDIPLNKTDVISGAYHARKTISNYSQLNVFTNTISAMCKKYKIEILPLKWF